MGTLLGFPHPAPAGTVVTFPVRVVVTAPDGRVAAEIGLTDVEDENVQLLVGFAAHGRVVATDRTSGRVLFDSASPRLSWPDRPDPITSQL